METKLQSYGIASGIKDARNDELVLPFDFSAYPVTLVRVGVTKSLLLRQLASD
jgi:hypothetical protein